MNWDLSGIISCVILRIKHLNCSGNCKIMSITIRKAPLSEMFSSAGFGVYQSYIIFYGQWYPLLQGMRDTKVVQHPLVLFLSWIY